MALLITSAACGLLALLAAAVLQFRLPFWRTLAGLDRTGAEKYANIDVHRLRRRLSILLYALSAGLLVGALLLYIKTITENLAISLFFLLLLLVFDGMYFVFRKFDRNVYSDSVRRSRRLFFVAANAFFALLGFLFVR